MPRLPASSQAKKVERFLTRHQPLQKLYAEDHAFWKHELIKNKGKYFPPNAFRPENSSLLLHEVAVQTGVKPKPREKVDEWLSRALNGKNVCVLGTRYGLLNKIFELFGAKTYGVDVDENAVKKSLERGLNVKRVEVADLPKAFPNEKPDFIVSLQFLDPLYWNSWQCIWNIPKTIKGIVGHTTNETIHVHDTTCLPPIKLDGLTQTKQMVSKEELPSYITVLKK